MISNGNTSNDNDKPDKGTKRNGGDANKDNRSTNTSRGSNSEKNVNAKNGSNNKAKTNANLSNNASATNSSAAPRKKRYNNNRNNRNGGQNGSDGNHNHKKTSNSTSLALNNNNHENSGIFEKFATWVSKAAGTTPAFLGAIVIVVGWGVSGPFFNFSETWQLVINTGTTIITFLMVFLIQKAQNKDSLAIQLKLNELVASHEFSSNRLVDIESMTEDEMKVVQKYYRSLSELSKGEEKLQTSHSIEEAEDQHELKSDRRSKRNSQRDRS